MSIPAVVCCLKLKKEKKTFPVLSCHLEKVRALKGEV